MNIDQQLRQIMEALAEVKESVELLNRRWERRESAELRRDMMEVRSIAEAQMRRIDREAARLREPGKQDKFNPLFERRFTMCMYNEETVPTPRLSFAAKLLHRTMLRSKRRIDQYNAIPYEEFWNDLFNDEVAMDIWACIVNSTDKTKINNAIGMATQELVVADKLAIADKWLILT